MGLGLSGAPAGRKPHPCALGSGGLSLDPARCTCAVVSREFLFWVLGFIVHGNFGQLSHCPSYTYVYQQVLLVAH